MKKLAFFAVLIFLTITACKEPFTPEVEAKFKNLLVVEGYLNIGGSSTFTLSRTGDLKDFQARIPEPDARVEVQDSKGTITQAITAENGQCSVATTSLNPKENYRVKITTQNGNIYQTDYLDSKTTPPIDSISRRVENNGFKLYVSTHDSSNSARFYSWDFHETWEITSPYISLLEFKNGKLVRRDQNINISRCWQNNTSSEILLGSTERQSEDKISDVPVAFVAGNSIKLGELYSIVVRQYAHSLGGYQYLENMKKNTEKIGTIFDPQPSEIKGNINSISNPEEQVIGWVDAGTVTEKRIFINQRERLSSWAYRREPCDLKNIPLDSVVYYTNALYLITDYGPFDPAIQPPFEAVVTKARCIDCRLLGSNVKPSFWPE